MQDEPHTEPAPAAEERPMPRQTDGTVDVPLTDGFGNATGVTMQVATGEVEPVESDLNGFRRLAKRVRSWGPMVVDGEPYEADEGNREQCALNLFNRFPHFAAQVKRAIGEDAA